MKNDRQNRNLAEAFKIAEDWVVFGTLDAFGWKCLDDFSFYANVWVKGLNRGRACK